MNCRCLLKANLLLPLNLVPYICIWHPCLVCMFIFNVILMMLMNNLQSFNSSLSKYIEYILYRAHHYVHLFINFNEMVIWINNNRILANPQYFQSEMCCLYYVSTIIPLYYGTNFVFSYEFERTIFILQLWIVVIYVSFI